MQGNYLQTSNVLGSYFSYSPLLLQTDDDPLKMKFLDGMSTHDLRNELSEFSPGGVLGSAFDSQSDNFFYVT
jgi:hypothetical protein